MTSNELVSETKATPGCPSATIIINAKTASDYADSSLLSPDSELFENIYDYTDGYAAEFRFTITEDSIPDKEGTVTYCFGKDFNDEEGNANNGAYCYSFTTKQDN
jgi:hypothetical protein